jgi:ankyrin repeat protein
MMTTLVAPLVEAVLAKDLPATRRLLDDRADANVRDPHSGLTALMIACGRSQPEIVGALLDAGADVHVLDSRAGATALHKTCQGGSLECARMLVNAGAFVDAQCVSTGHTPLVEAIWFKHPDIVEFLLDQGAGLKIDTHYGFTLRQHIDYALSVNEIGRELLVESDAAVRARQQADNAHLEAQPLMAAVLEGSAAFREGDQAGIEQATLRVKQLVDEGAEIDARYPILNGFNDDHTPLLVACRDGLKEIAVALLEAGADVNATEPTFGAVPLHKAVYNGHDEITDILVQQATIDLDFQGATNGYTPLLDAIWHGFAACTSILIEAGARLDLAGHDGATPLELAAQNFGAGHEITRTIRARTET